MAAAAAPITMGSSGPMGLASATPKVIADAPTVMSAGAGIITQQGKLYLCIVLDLYDQRIVGWSMHARQDRQMGDPGCADGGLAAARKR